MKKYFRAIYYVMFLMLLSYSANATLSIPRNTSNLQGAVYDENGRIVRTINPSTDSQGQQYYKNISYNDQGAVDAIALQGNGFSFVQLSSDVDQNYDGQVSGLYILDDGRLSCSQHTYSSGCSSLYNTNKSGEFSLYDAEGNKINVNYEIANGVLTLTDSRGRKINSWNEGKISLADGSSIDFDKFHSSLSYNEPILSVPSEKNNKLIFLFK